MRERNSGTIESSAYSSGKRGGSAVYRKLSGETRTLIQVFDISEDGKLPEVECGERLK